MIINFLIASATGILCGTDDAVWACHLKCLGGRDEVANKFIFNPNGTEVTTCKAQCPTICPPPPLPPSPPPPPSLPPSPPPLFYTWTLVGPDDAAILNDALLAVYALLALPDVCPAIAEGGVGGRPATADLVLMAVAAINGAFVPMLQRLGLPPLLQDITSHNATGGSVSAICTDRNKLNEPHYCQDEVKTLVDSNEKCKQEQFIQTCRKTCAESLFLGAHSESGERVSLQRAVCGGTITITNISGDFVDYTTPADPNNTKRECQSSRCALSLIDRNTPTNPKYCEEELPGGFANFRQVLAKCSGGWLRNDGYDDTQHFMTNCGLTCGAGGFT